MLLKGVDLIKISFPYLGTSNSKFIRLNLTQRVTGSLVVYKLKDARLIEFFYGALLF